MKQLGKALQKAGFELKPIKKKGDRYMILHLPSAQYIMKFSVEPTRSKPTTPSTIEPVIVVGRAKAGHIRDQVTGREGRKRGEYYFLTPIPPKTQLHKACFEFVLVDKDEE